MALAGVAFKAIKIVAIQEGKRAVNAGVMAWRRASPEALARGPTRLFVRVALSLGGAPWAHWQGRFGVDDAGDELLQLEAL